MSVLYAAPDRAQCELSAHWIRVDPHPLPFGGCGLNTVLMGRMYELLKSACVGANDFGCVVIWEKVNVCLATSPISTA